MDKMEKEKRSSDFETWITFLPDKVIELKKELPENISKFLNQSIDSLDIIEEYLLKNYTQESIIQDKFFLDKLASYTGTVFSKNLPNSYWYIELANSKDVFFCLPVLKVKDAKLAPFSPYNMVTALFVRKKGNFLSSILIKSIEKIKG